ncbi:MAG: hypothetical protein ACR2F6_12190 [Mycobacteriales bacterium]
MTFIEPQTKPAPPHRTKPSKTTMQVAVGVGVAAQLSDDVLSALIPFVHGFWWPLSVLLALGATAGGAYAVAGTIKAPRDAGTVGLIVGATSGVAGLLLGAGGFLAAILTVIVGVVAGIAAGQKRVDRDPDW